MGYSYTFTAANKRTSKDNASQFVRDLAKNFGGRAAIIATVKANNTSTMYKTVVDVCGTPNAKTDKLAAHYGGRK